MLKRNREITFALVSVGFAESILSPVGLGAGLHATASRECGDRGVVPRASFVSDPYWCKILSLVAYSQDFARTCDGASAHEVDFCGEAVIAIFLPMG